MLERLRVRNFALIEELALSFSPGLNILTGETGTGKSILLGALSVVLGERITDEFFRSDAESLEVEATFTARELELPQWLDAEDGIINVLRTAGREKRAQNFVNQRQVTQTAIVELGDGLVDIHGQHQHQLLLKSSSHGRFLDAHAGLEPLRNRYTQTFSEYQDLLGKIKKLTDDLARRREQRDFFEFQLKEITQLDSQPGELESLKQESELLASAERRAELVNRLVQLISEQDASILEGLALASQMLKDLTALDPALQESLKTLSEAVVATDEVWHNLVRYRESIEYSPERLEEINQRLFAFERLLRKHNVDETGLLALREELEKKLSSIELDAEEIAALEKKKTILYNEVVSLAGQLSARRHEIKRDFEKAIEAELEQLAMPKARLVVDFLMTEDQQGLYEEQGKRYRLSENGVEEVQFLFSANPGEDPKPLSRIASGGELSRIMLTLKTVLVDADRVPVLVFDEIDVGIGGKTAEIVGKRLLELASKKQILLVTHLAQIARYADRHFRVTKETQAKKTVTRIQQLDDKDRVEELARMLGGETITDTVRAHAKELLEGRK